MFIISIYLFFVASVIYFSSEYGVTNKRVIMKFGWISRSSLEIPHNRIESLAVNQGVLGRVLNYGTVMITGTGGSTDVFYDLPNPLAFRRAAQDQLELLDQPADAG